MKQGLSLIEVVVALSLFAVGILGSTLLQASSLKISNDAQTTRVLTELASAQLSLQRQVNRSNVNQSSTGGTCKGSIPDKYHCSLTIKPCIFDSGELRCTTETQIDKVAHYIEVNVSYDEINLKLATLARIE